MATYRINEGEFELPVDWDDRSTNVFTVGNTLPVKLSVVITRDRVDPNQDLSEYVDGKLDDVSGQLKQFKLIEKRQIEVAGTVALEAELTWRADVGVMYQRQTYVRHGDRLLVVTATARRELREEHRAQIDAMLATLRFTS